MLLGSYVNHRAAIVAGKTACLVVAKVYNGKCTMDKQSVAKVLVLKNV